VKLHADVEVIKETPEYIYLKAIGHNVGLTITNDAEWVVSQLVNEHNLGMRRVFYMDSLGQIDELTHVGAHFTGYKYGHEGVVL
jgi:hypothetical protein